MVQELSNLPISQITQSFFDNFTDNSNVSQILSEDCLQGKLQNIAHQHIYLDDEQSRDQVIHVLDWILAAISSNDPPT
jgi:hypothetical protein